MSSSNKHIMRDKILNAAFPMTGGSIGAVSPIVSAHISWSCIGDMALQGAILALVGGVIGWLVKRVLDSLFKKK